MLFVRFRAPRASATRFRSSIALRLVAAILLFSAIVTVALTALQLLLKYERGVAAIDERLEDIRTSYLASLGEGLWRMDEQQLRLQLGGILRLSDIRAAEIRELSSSSTPLLVTAGQRGGENVISRDYPIAYRIRGVEKQIGVLHVEATLAGLYRELRSTALVILVGQGAQTFLVSFFGIYILWRLLTRHLSTFAQFVDSYDVHEPPAPFRLDRRPPREPDELDKVVVAFNDLCANLQAAYDDLREREARIRRLVESNIIGIFFWHLSGTITQANDAFLDMVGHSREDLLSRRVSWTDMTSPEYADADEHAIAELKATGSCRPYEKDFLHRDGHRVPVFLGGALVEGSGDEGVAFVVDLTERRQAEAKARAYEVERKRAEALAELDHAKTAFFSNVSHEFRTPLTLALGPLEALLDSGRGALPAGVREQVAMAHRNCLRLMRLVNTLLDFSRIEAGRVRARYEPTDLARFTADLASCFRSACEQAGLRLHVDCPPLPAPVHVDPDMWEKIVLNLVSNAFKFTLDGEIEVKLRAAEDRCELSVRDTGVGIPEAELPRIFERFHRVEQSGGRTLEGTGIGLALVQELAKLHGGSVRVESALGRGSTFTVAVPFGTAHLPAERFGAARELAATGLGARPYVEEALRWIPAGERGGERGVAHPTAEGVDDRAPGRWEDRPGEARPRVLLADDNADMREYVRHLLAKRYEVEAVADGQAALEAARRTRPALVLSDVMMPRLDGFALLRELRADLGLRTVPVVLLSARAGEESRVGGLEAGADDYLVKPFSARELLARVTTNLELARFREKVEHERAARAAAEEAIRLRDEFLSIASHELRTPITSLQLVVQSLERGVREGRPSVSPQMLTLAARQTQRLTALVTQLLDVVRIQSGRLTLTLEEFDLAADARQILERMQMQVERARSPVRLHADGAIAVRWDRSRIDQLLTNLLSNALSYGAGQPIDLTLERVGSNGDGRVRITLRDRGIGIPADRLPHIFERFERATSTRHYGGLGLGLFIARQTVQAHGGTISAESELGRGSTFTVELPLQPPEKVPR